MYTGNIRPRLDNVICRVNLRSSQFTWTKGRGVAEISDFGRGWNFGRIYNDACDVGFKLLSERTGQDVVFYATEQRDRENELTHWVCKPIPEDVRQGRVLANVEIHILND